MRKRKSDPFDGYGLEIFFAEEHGWLAHLGELPSISAFGATPEEAIAELAVARSAAKETYKARRIKIPARLDDASTAACSRSESTGAFINLSQSKPNGRV